MKQKFYAELSRRLREEGIESSYAGTQNLNVSLHGQPVLCVTPSSEIYILPAGSKNEEVNDLYHRVGATADEVYEYVEAVQSSPLLRASDLKEEFRLLADFGCAVLAGRERENDRGYQFVTWVWDFDRRGVSHGHYFEGNYHAAKEDFAVRSGLISRAQLFSADQLAELYRATDFFLEEGPEPEDKQMKAFQEARTKIEYTVPDLQERLELPRTRMDIPSRNGTSSPYLNWFRSYWHPVRSKGKTSIRFSWISCRKTTKPRCWPVPHLLPPTRP